MYNEPAWLEMQLSSTACHTHRPTPRVSEHTPGVLLLLLLLLLLLPTRIACRHWLFLWWGVLQRRSKPCRTMRTKPMCIQACPDFDAHQ